MTDLILAIVHHLLVFGLIAMLTMERQLLSANPVNLKRLAGLDAGYGATAGLVLAVGACRVLFGARGWAFYEGNPYFWMKLGFFALMGLASIPPTLAILKWRKALNADAAFQPTPAEARRIGTWTGVQFLFLVMVLVSAAAMARNGAF